MSVTKDEDSTVSGKKNTNKPAANKRPDYAQSASHHRAPAPVVDALPPWRRR